MNPIIEIQHHVALTWDILLQEDMYSYVTYADDQITKGKGTSIVEL